MSTTEDTTGGATGGSAGATTDPADAELPGNDKLLLGIVLAVVTFWLFAGSAGTVAPSILDDVNSTEEYVDASSMNLAVSITALFSGLFIVLMGGIADRVGRVRITLVGIAIGVVGSVLLILADGSAALVLLLVGRALQGFSAACVMPATMALVKTYWDGAARQRAVSMWSIGSWGGSGLAAVFGGGVVRYVGWRGIFVASIVVSALAFLLILGTPESKVTQRGPRRSFDILGLCLFIVGTLGLMVVLLFGSRIGWTSLIVMALVAVAAVAWVLFVVVEQRTANPFIDFTLFSNTTFTGATISNFLLNGTIGMLIVSQQLIQLAAERDDGEPYTAWDAGLLTIGYGVAIIGFIRVGEKLLQRLGPRKPMIWGTLIVAVACIMLMATNLVISQYVVLAVIAYSLFGIGLAFYATPSTDAALANLPAEQAGSGAGIYKMASSLGSAIGAALSLAVFTGLAGSGAAFVGSVVSMSGRTDNIELRQAGLVGIGVSLLFCVLAVLSITTTVPKGGGRRQLGTTSPPEPEPQLPPDEERAALVARLSQYSLEELRALEHQVLLNEVARVDRGVLERIVRSQRD